MKNIINTIKTDKVMLWGFSISLGLILITTIILVLSFRLLPPVIPLYNGMSWGYARLAGKLLIFLPIGIAAIFYICNTIISSLLYKRAALLSRLLCATTILLTTITGLFSIQIILLIH